MPAMIVVAYYSYIHFAIFLHGYGYNYLLHLPMEGWPGWVVLGGWLSTKTAHLANRNGNLCNSTFPGDPEGHCNYG